MPSAAKPASPVMLVCGDDEFAVKQRARQIYEQWSQELGGMDHETIEATVGNSDEADRALSRLREALQTLPFFGSGKAIWLRDCNFLGDERAAQSQLVTERLADLAQELKSFVWQNVRLLVSAGKVDKRKTFFKTLEKIGKVESLDGWSEKDWVNQAGMSARKAIQSRAKQIVETALEELISRVGPYPRQLESEIEKLCLFVGQRPQITEADVAAICTHNKMARAFALGDALGNRDLPALLRRLDEELWEIRLKIDKDKSEIGLLYGLIAKVRALLMLKEMLREGWVKPTSDYNNFKSQLERVPAEKLPADRRFNPLALNPYVLYKALPQVRNYTGHELVRAMDLLLQCNRRLVSSNLDEALVIQQVLVQIVGGTENQRRAAA
jgi:DNA polymerase-3 subunit delta